jgi:uncharacterized OB-fold protein
MNRPMKPSPVPTPETAPYWEGAARGELTLPRCTSCEQFFFYPRSTCPECGSGDTEWQRVSGLGTLHTYLITHVAAPGFADDVPMAIAVVQLAEGPRMMSNIVGIDNAPDTLILDMPLQVTFRQRNEFWLPVFEPVRAS